MGAIYHKGQPYSGQMVVDTALNANSNNPVKNSVIKAAIDAILTDEAIKNDVASINIIGTTNTTGATISKGTYFYLNGTLVKAKSDIAANTTFTLNTNYKVVTAGGLNDLSTVMDGIIHAMYLTRTGNVGANTKLKLKNPQNEQIYLVFGCISNTSQWSFFKYVQKGVYEDIQQGNIFSGSTNVDNLTFTYDSNNNEIVLNTGKNYYIFIIASSFPITLELAS